MLIVARMGSLCANFAVVAPPVRNSTRDASFSVSPDVINNWLRSLTNLPDSDSLHDACANTNSNGVPHEHSSTVYDAPGGAFVMETLLHTGQYAPTETRIFHHIILVGLFSALLRCFIFFENVLAHTRVWFAALARFDLSCRSMTEACNVSLAEGQRLGPVTSRSRCRRKCELYLRAHTYCRDCHPVFNVVASSHPCSNKVGYFSFLALSLGCRVVAMEPAAHMMP